MGTLPDNVEVVLVPQEPEPIPDLAGVDLVIPYHRIRETLLDLLDGAARDGCA